jgi:hypothetical protein
MKKYKVANKVTDIEIDTSYRKKKACYCIQHYNNSPDKYNNHADEERDGCDGAIATTITTITTIATITTWKSFNWEVDGVHFTTYPNQASNISNQSAINKY